MVNMSTWHALLLVLVLPTASGHATLLKPAPRSTPYEPQPYQDINWHPRAPAIPGVFEDRNTFRWSIKFPLDVFDARSVVDAGCGGAYNRDPGPQPPRVAYKPGTAIVVEWELALAHYPLDDSGVRIALQYDESDRSNTSSPAFADNVLAGGVGRAGEGALDFTPVSAETIEVGGSVGRSIVRLPAGRTCDACVLQFAHVAYQHDGPGGLYFSCADIAITADGRLPLQAAALADSSADVVRQLPTGRPGALAWAGPALVLAGTTSLLAALWVRHARAHQREGGDGDAAATSPGAGRAVLL